MKTIGRNLVQFREAPINYNNRYVAPMPQGAGYDDDMFVMQEMSKAAQKKERSQEKYQKWMAYGTAGIAVGLVGSLILSLVGFLKGGGKTAAEQEMKELTKATIKWVDFKDKKDVVAPLNSKTTAQSLREAFNNILNGKKLSEKALRWGGATGKDVDMIYLYGHGGTGKTYVAQQYAQEIGAIFTSIKYPDMGSPFKDAASMKVSNTFDEIVKIAQENKDRPVVVCIDEFDAVIKKVKDGINGSEEAGKTRAAVLTGMDAVRQRCHNVTFIATSNYHPKNGQVDEIALRRFNNQIEVPLPNKEQIEGVLDMYLSDMEAIKGKNFVKSSEVQKFINKLQKEGYSNGEIRLIAEEAGKIFRASLKDVKDEDLVKHPFKVEYLEKALQLKGIAASKTNRLMDDLNEFQIPQQFIQRPERIKSTKDKFSDFINKIKKLLHIGNN